MVVSTIESQIKSIRDTMKEYLALLAEVNKMREVEAQKQKEGCFYYIDTDNVFPMNGRGIFDYQVVSAYLDYKLITKDNIKFYFTSHKQAPVLNTFITNVYKTKHGKSLTNLLIGSFNITKNKYATANFIVDNWLEAGYYYHLSGPHTTISSIKLDNKELYRIQGFEERDKLSNNKLIYVSIVQRANLETYKLLKYIESIPNATPVKIKGDFVFYAYNPKKGKIKIPKSTVFGAYREEKKVPELKQPKKEPRTTMQVFIQPKWKEVIAPKDTYFDHTIIPNYSRVFVLGFAGSGKTHAIPELQKQFQDDFAYIAFTHTAANKINGQTAHSFFGISEDGSVDEAKIKSILSAKQGIFIDEINQLPLCIYRILAYLPKSFKIYGFGDFRQEAPVKERSYFDSQMFLELFNGNLIRLQKQCRSDAEYANACIEYHDTEDWSVMQPFLHIETIDKIEPEDEINITKTNLLRKLINRKMMEKQGTASSPIIMHDKSNAYSQDMILYPGLPVISTKTRKDKNLFNNEMFVVEEYTDEEIKLNYRKLNKAETKNKTITVSITEFARLFAPAYALTTYKIEGATIDIPHSIYEFDLMGIKSRYTALTRATDCSLITIRTGDINIKNREEVGNLGGYTCYIYKITDGNQFYIGSTAKQLNKRLNEHKEQAKTGASKFYRYMRKHGPENFCIEQLFKFTANSYEHQLEIEEYYIEINDSVNIGLNTKYK